jgi:molybdate transport system substrate-binding protein
MTDIRKTTAALCLAACLGLAASPAFAEEIRVLSAGAAKSAVNALALPFHEVTGDRVVASFDTVGGLRKRLAGGESADLVIASAESLDAMERDEVTVPKARLELGQVQIAVAVKDGAALPDIGTPQAFKSALLAAKSIAAIDPAHGGTSGIHFDKVLHELGIYEQVKSKLVLLPGGSVADAVMRGDAEMGVQQSSELVGVPGLRVVGPLPGDLQLTTRYGAAIVRHTKVAPEAATLMRYMALSEDGRAAFKAAGFAVPARQ